MDYSIIMILSMLILSAFFSGMEIAYVSSNKVHIAIEKQQDGFLSKILQKITSKGDQINTARIDSSIEKYARVLLSDTPMPVPNAIQRQRGIDSTTHMCGEVLYSST